MLSQVIYSIVLLAKIDESYDERTTKHNFIFYEFDTFSGNFPHRKYNDATFQPQFFLLKFVKLCLFLSTTLMPS